MIEHIENFKTYLESRSLSINTVDAYHSDLKQFYQFCLEQFVGEEIHFSEISSDLVRFYLVKLFKENISSRSISRKLSSLRMFFKYLILFDIVTTNPMKSLKNPKYSKKLPLFFSQSEIMNLCDLPDVETISGIRDKAMFELFYSSGLRISELVDLKIQDIDFTKKVITILGKGRKKRVVPLTEIALEYLLKYNKVRDYNIDYFFQTKKKKSFTRGKIYYIVKKYINQLSLRAGYSPHTIRHSFASHLLNNGADLFAIKEMMGHSSLATTEVYTHISPDVLRSEYLKGHPRSEKKFDK
ncbi:MAG: tyrosine-type recombinase/integrase [Candidatus Cloacimonetes bacterium]|nr:tyrosine-type recombinase/integrase [Candidatus Cloacimonadota bacterium]